jgi:hypothetical protein
MGRVAIDRVAIDRVAIDRVAKTACPYQLSASDRCRSSSESMYLIHWAAYFDERSSRLAALKASRAFSYCWVLK